MMIKFKDGIITIGYNDTLIVLDKVVTVSMNYESSMFSDGKWQLKVNDIVVHSSYNIAEIREMKSFIKAKLEEMKRA